MYEQNAGRSPLSGEITAQVEKQLHKHEHLTDALIDSGLSRRFQAMVLGLAAIKDWRNEPAGERDDG